MDPKRSRLDDHVLEDPVDSTQASSRRTRKKRTQLTTVACNYCRTKKSACDGKRPVCSNCQAHGFPCVYVSNNEMETPAMLRKREAETLKSTAKGLNELVNHLRYMPDDIAVSLLRRLRVTSDVTTVLQAVQNDLMRVRSDDPTSRPTMLPHMHSGVELELMTRHPFVYPSFAPGASSLFSESSVVQTARQKTQPDIRPDSNTQYLSSLPRRSQKASKLGPDNETPHGHDVLDSAQEGQSTDLDSNAVPFPTSQPFNPDYYYDPRLDSLKIAFWTDVPVTNHWAAAALTSYLETDHRVLGLFDPIWFVSHLVGRRTEYVTRLLVNSLLACASLAYAQREPDGVKRSREFRVWALRLREKNDVDDSLSTISSLVYLFLACAGDGEGEKAQTYLREFVSMSKRMKLFGIISPITIKDIRHLPTEIQSLYARCAWGAFNLAIMQSLSHSTDPIQYPPALPMPGKVQLNQTVENELDPSYTPDANVGQSFPHFCTLWTWTAENLRIHRGVDDSQVISLANAQAKYHKLLAWADDLPESMVCGDHCTHDVLVFHTYFHCVVLDLFRPFLIIDKKHGSGSSPVKPVSAGTIFAASVTQLKRLYLNYRNNHSSAKYCYFWHISMLYIANAVLMDTSDPEWRYYFFLCIHDCAYMYPCFRYLGGIVQSLLVMAVSKGNLGSSDAKMIIEEMRAQTNSDHKIGDGIGSSIVDLNLAVSNPTAANVISLTAQFQEIATFDEFTKNIL